MKVFELAVFCLLGYCLLNFFCELYWQQKTLDPLWNGLSFEEKALENINLGLMDLKLVFTVLGFICWGFWVKT
jgi:hypothetical protein